MQTHHEACEPVLVNVPAVQLLQRLLPLALHLPAAQLEQEEEPARKTQNDCVPILGLAATM